MSKAPRSCEILAPGGGLDHALWALEGGADAVYIGYRQFSARSHAHNLDLDEIAQLCGAASARGARIFCALNTILDPAETAEAVGLAWRLYHRGVSAFIVQDLGLALALGRHGPPVALHASTQAAVHSPGGAAALKALGFRRVVLAREMTLAEIGAIVRADPELEYEVFVHGALCYAVSGNCMASGLMLGRSANRGDCGQVCRTKFTLDTLIPGPRRQSSPHEEGQPEGIHAPPGELTWKEGLAGAFASMNDLELGPRIRELRDLGVVSFKIEGRMKPPAYGFHTARAYKGFLAGGRDAEAWADLDQARVRFGRLPSPGWVDGHKALAQTNPGWAGSLGLPLGLVAGAEGSRLRVALPPGAKAPPAKLRGLAKGDGVMLLGAGPGQTLRTALAAPAEARSDGVWLSLAAAPGFDPQQGSLWLVSRHDGKLPEKRGARPWRHPVPVFLRAEKVDGDPGTLRLVCETPAFGGLRLEERLDAEAARGLARGADQAVGGGSAGAVTGGPDTPARQADAGALHPGARAASAGALPAAPTAPADAFAEELRRHWTASDCGFSPAPLTVHNGAGFVFVPPRVLKEARRRWWAAVEAAAEAWAADAAARVTRDGDALPDRRSVALAGMPSRADLSPRRGVNARVGFIIEWEGLAAAHLAPTPWGLALPLAPFTPAEASYFARFRSFLERLRADDPQARVFPGLNNPSHVTWLHRLRDEGFDLPAYFGDWGFHAANPWTAEALEHLLPGCVAVLPWLEAAEVPDRSYFPPLFTSRSCMLRNSFAEAAQNPLSPKAGPEGFDSRQWTQARLAGQPGQRPTSGPRCPADCAGHFSARLTQGKTRFRVEARDCLNYLILEDPDAGGV